MFPHGATSYDRNKMVLTEFPYGVTTFFHQHFHMVLFILRNKLDFAFASASEILSSVTIRMNSHYSLMF